MKIARAADRIVATKGKKVVVLDMKKDKPSDDDITGLVVGPSGKLRAPAIRIGKVLVIGFEQESYEQWLS